MSEKLEFFYDYVSVYSYLANSQLQGISREYSDIHGKTVGAALAANSLNYAVTYPGTAACCRGIIASCLFTSSSMV